MINILFWTWCLPQTLLGFLIYSVYKIRNKITDIMPFNLATVIIIKTRAFTGVSLGKYIILNETESNNEKMMKHEYGHTIQNFILGISYLFVVGIPSVIRNIIWSIKNLPSEKYYKGYPENWADTLGGVER